MDVVDNIITDEEKSIDNEENNSQKDEERSHENEERPNENEERPNENKERHCGVQKHMDDENINDNVHDKRITVDDEEIIVEIRPLPSTAQDQSSLKSRIRPRNKTPNSHRHSFSKEFIHTHVKKNRVTWKNNTKRTKLNIKDKFRHMVATCMTLLSKHNKHATVSVKKGKKDMVKKQWMYY